MLEELQKLRVVQVGQSGVRDLADVMMVLTEDGSVALGITTLCTDIVVADSVDDELSNGMQQQLRIHELTKEYNPGMDLEAHRAWAAELVSLLATDL